MKSVAHREIALSSIVLGGDFNAWIAAHKQEVADIVESRRSLLLAHVPVVEAKTMRLVAGRRRVAALLADEVKRHVVHLVEGTPAELRRLAAVENLHRGHGDDLTAARVAYVDELEAELADDRAATTQRGPGRPQTPRGKAREVAAHDLGTTPEALRKAEAREAAKAAPVSITDGALAEPAIAMHGIEAPPEWLSSLRMRIEVLTAVRNKLRALIGEAGRLITEGDHSQTVREAIRVAGAAVDALIPVMACVYCRDPDGENGRSSQCSACGGEGTLTAEQAQRIPAEQLLPGAAPVVRAAALAPIAAAVAANGGWPAPKSPPARAKRHRIEDGEGRELVVEREPGEDDGLAF